VLVLGVLLVLGMPTLLPESLCLKLGIDFQGWLITKHFRIYVMQSSFLTRKLSVEDSRFYVNVTPQPFETTS